LIVYPGTCISHVVFSYEYTGYLYLKRAAAVSMYARCQQAKIQGAKRGKRVAAVVVVGGIQSQLIVGESPRHRASGQPRTPHATL